MNEDFLSKFRQSPRHEFTESLYTKLTQDAKAEPSINLYSTKRRIAYTLAVLCLIFALTIAMSPSARAAALMAVDSIIAKITVRGTTVFVNSDEPPAVPTGISESYSVIWTPVSPDDIVADYPFFAKIPAWVPAGYVLQDRAALFYFSMYEETPHHALFEWKNKTGATIQLQVMRGACPNGPGPSEMPTSDCTLLTYISVGLTSEPQVIAVNGQPAVFFRGVPYYVTDLSGSVREWNPERGKPIRDSTKGAWMTWESDGRVFTLVATSNTITKKGLLRVAESIP